jgi:ADP-heptose:LPS heptosyltransferase
LKNTPANIIISRTDSIGDVVLTLPVAAVLKKHFPNMQIGFMGKSYTRDVIEACTYIDQFIDVQDFLTGTVLINGQKPEAILHVFPVPQIAARARKLGIPFRIGTTNRIYHWTSCNQLVRLSRKKSSLHEAQLNIKLLSPLGINTDYSLEEIGNMYGLAKLQPLQPSLQSLLDPQRYKLILHPKSQGSGREWPLDHFIQLARSLNPDNYQIFISGTQKEHDALQPLLKEVGDLVTDLTGKMTLKQFMSFIEQCNGLVASGTGPIHLAAALGIDAMGIFPPIRPVHPGRWRPVGPKAKVFVMDKNCMDCKRNPASCHCMGEINALAVKNYLDETSDVMISDVRTDDHSLKGEQ